MFKHQCGCPFCSGVLPPWKLSRSHNYTINGDVSEGFHMRLCLKKGIIPIFIA